MQENNKIDFPWDAKINIKPGEDFFVKLKELAKPSCNKCHGRGFIGYRDIIKQGRLVHEDLPCICILKRIKKDKEEQLK